jgi:membrane protein implicated in regulation of membrane protease activity
MDVFMKLGMPVIWSILIVLFSVIEGLTLGLTSIWFAIGAIFALIASLFKLSVFNQIIAFVLSSFVMIVYTKPIAQKSLKIGATKTNVEELVGKKAIVTKKINEHEPGLVKVKGQIWTAISEDGNDIEVGTEVIVVMVEGVKLVVKLGN